MSGTAVISFTRAHELHTDINRKRKENRVETNDLWDFL